MYGRLTGHYERLKSIRYTSRYHKHLSYIVTMLQDATVRKLYSTVRHDLKKSWGFQESIQLTNGSTSLVKSDSKMSAAGLYNGVTLSVVAQSGPYSWDLFVKLPGKSTASTVTLYEVRMPQYCIFVCFSTISTESNM